MATVQTSTAAPFPPSALLPRPSPSTHNASSLLGPVVLTLLIHAALMAAYVAAFHGDISSLVCVDRDSIGRFPYEAVHVGFGAQGYDGQYYYLLARNPWAPQTSHLDLPAFRHARVLLPVLAWLATGGNAYLLLWAIPAINLMAITGLSWVGAAVARHYRMSPWWGCVLPLILNAGAPALRDLTDPLATFSVCALLAAWLMRSGPWLLLLWGVAAVFSREQNLIVVGLLLSAALWTRRPGAALCLVVPLALWSSWAIVLRFVYGAWPSPGDNLAMPFAGMAWRWTHLGANASKGPVQALLMALLCLQVVLALFLIYSGRGGVVRALLIAATALAVVAGPAIYASPWSYLRVLAWLPLGVWLSAMRARRAWPVLVIAPSSVWTLLAVFQAWRG